jgi:hypothetical protein
MADYTTITDAQVDPEAPITSELMSALRDNPLAIAEAAATAPRIAPRAIDSLLAGPVSNSFPQYSFGGTTVLATLTDLDDCYVLFAAGTIRVDNPGSSSMKVELSSDNGSTWVDSVTIAEATDTSSANDPAIDTGGNLVPMVGYNAARIVHEATLEIFSAATLTNGSITAGSF